MDPTADDLHKNCLQKNHGCIFDGCDYFSYFPWCVRRHMTETRKHRVEAAQLSTAPRPIFRSASFPAQPRGSSPSSSPVAAAQSRVVSADSSQLQQSYDIRLVSGFKVWVCGSSGAGKSVWIINLIKHLPTVCVDPPTKVLFVYRSEQPIYDQVRSLVTLFVQDGPGISSIVQERIDEWVGRGEKVLLIADDMLLTRDSAFHDLIAESFTVGRHTGVSVVFATQKCFPNSEPLRLAHQNANYAVYFNNPQDRGEFARLAQRSFPGQKKNAMAMFDRVMAKEYGHLIISFLPNPKKITFLSELFDKPHIVKAYMMDPRSSSTAAFPRHALFREMYLVDSILLQQASAAPTAATPNNAGVVDDNDEAGRAKRKRETDENNEEEEEAPPAKKGSFTHDCDLCGGSFDSRVACRDHILSVHRQYIRAVKERAAQIAAEKKAKAAAKKRLKLSVVDDVGLSSNKDPPAPSTTYHG